ncbi:hypothetical protein N7478_013169 [Penicillium angulare]|uniref:uncharacterized protein n=1 Tax=Penicillium angulare TaxID=116970 RepID=UPI002540C7B9|nr:uncharacterized protein N7478_013169 [Penicillium angulare]KAJ5257065.1 hypothetical protein N7478_013169 [Penicillium angulare]
MSRSLPAKNNPLILADATPAYDELIIRRRLGRSKITAKPGLLNACSATKPENLGVFEYVHLRASLPQDLEGSEIFPSRTNSYYLMRRSNDGFVSATGMFKVAFPYATAEEEMKERDYMRSQEYTSQEEVACNIWIPPVCALELAKEYKMYDWIRALLDPADIKQNRLITNITPPPKFELPMDESNELRRNHNHSPQLAICPSKDSTSSHMLPQAQSINDELGAPSTIGADDNAQKTHEIIALMEATNVVPLPAKAEADSDDTEVKTKERE